MNETVFNTNQRDKSQYMFFGEGANIARYDELTYPIFDKLTKKQKGFFWTPEEIDLNKDAKDYKTLSDIQKHIFTKTLSYQIMLDSVQARSPALALLPFCTIPELEACIEWWCAMEQVHNSAYSYLIRNVYANPADVFDNIVLNDNIIGRAKHTIKYYDEFVNAANQYRAETGKVSLDELKEKLVLCVASINALEGLSFYASFACSFAFAEQGLMVGNANEISLIARDEALHLAITQNILKKWASGQDDPIMKTIYHDKLDEIRAIYENIIEQEREWSAYLFKDGSLLGLNEKILNDYVEYMAGKRMKNLGIKTGYSSKNPLSWTEKYLTSSDLQVSPQETEVTSYTIGGIKNDLEDMDFSPFKL